MIQDIAPKKFHNEFQLKKPNENDRIAVFLENNILIKEKDSHWQLPKRAEIENVLGHSLTVDTYLFCIDQDSYYLYSDDPGAWDDTKTDFH